MGRLSEHFSWLEAVASVTASKLGINNIVPAALRPNVQRTAAEMEKVRTLLGEIPLRVNSWYRSPALNKAIGGSKTSAHMKGLAVDFESPRLSNAEIFDRIAASDIQFDQLIHERTKSGADWVHIGFSEGPPRREVMRAAGQTLGGKMTFTRVAKG